MYAIVYYKSTLQEKLKHVGGMMLISPDLDII